MQARSSIPARSASSSGGTSPEAASASSRSSPPSWRQSRTRVAPPWLIRIEPRLLQPLERLAHGVPAGAEPLGQPPLGRDGGARRERAGEDLGPQPGVDAIGQKHWLDQFGRLVVPDTRAILQPMSATSEVTIVPANEASWEDLQAVFGTRGDPARCWCQRYKMQPKESWASVGAEELAFRLRAQTDCGHPESGTTSGLVAYLDGEPVGWCAVEPRTAYPRLLLKTRVPWEGRARTRTTTASGP